VIDHELRVGALAHFEDPAYYAQTYAPRVADVIHYVDLAKRVRGPVLEYGIGNGRVAIPMARVGIRVVGVDHSRPMLADLARRLREERPEVRARIEARQGDMRTKALGRRFDLVIAPFNVLLHLYTRRDVERFLARVRTHLSPRGRFVMDLSVPVPEDLARDPNVAHGAPPFRHPSAGVVRYQERFDYDRVRQILFVTMELTPKKSPKDAFVVPLAHRQFFPQEWEALLHYNGFEIDRVQGDFTGGKFDNDSDVMVVHARKARKAKR
ncbi:MAG TPA: class I SAM-dependent methyltransferase, partial [Polyangiaceae bacterium]|jgi:SAM-dependent methyltransferase|nr:class I SAM-dependent methyltransferase [Polyangiaceae bacterium]